MRRGPGALGHSLRDHARRRLAAAAGSGAETGRNDGAPSQPPRLRSGGPARRRRARDSCSRASRRRCPRSGWGTLFQFVFSGPRGIDLYAFAVSDVYQDLFGEGIFTGKGIYDVDAFETPWPTACRRTRSSPTISSRGSSLAPGSFRTSRSSKAFPATTRWRSRASTAGCGATGNCCPGCSRRAGPRPDRARRRDPGHRALEDARQPPAQPVGAGDFRDAARRLVPAGGRRRALDALRCSAPSCLPAILSFFSNLFPKRRGIAKRSFLRGVARDLAIGLAQAALRIVFLAHTAWMRSDAIAAHALAAGGVAAAPPRMGARRPGASRPGSRATGFYRRMRGAIVLAAAAGALVAARARAPGAWAAPFVASWLLSPLVARWVSLPPRDDASARLSPRSERGSCADRAPHLALLRAVRRSRVARPAGRQLPGSAAAGGRAAHFADQHRARPALDCVGQRLRLDRDRSRWLERLEATLDAIGRLERFRGHLYNWYDTDDLAAARAALRLDGRQRQPGRAPDDAQAGLPRAGRRPALTERGSRRGPRHARASAGCPLPALPGRRRPRRDVPPARGGVARGERAALARRRRRSRVGGAPGRPRGAAPRRWSTSCAPSARTTRPPTAGRPWSGRGRSRPASRATARRRGAGRFSRARQPSRRAFPRPPGGGAPGGGDGLHVSLRRVPGSLLDRLSPADGTLDPGHYDLLASEARLASFVAIARGDVPVEHWFHLGRPLTPVGRGSALVSWSGSMFEYLMPDLVLEAPSGQPARAHEPPGRAAADPVRAGARRPLGNLGGGLQRAGRPLHLPVLELRRQRPRIEARARGGSRRGAVRHGAGRHGRARGGGENFERLASIGALGRYGFYESIDYTTSRLPEGEPFAVVKAYMAHHQGMTIVALANVLLEATMRRRFGAEPPSRRRSCCCRSARPDGGRGAPAVRGRGGPPRARTRSLRCCGVFVRRTTPRRARICCPTGATRSWSPPRAPATAAGAAST